MSGTIPGQEQNPQSVDLGVVLHVADLEDDIVIVHLLAAVVDHHTPLGQDHHGLALVLHILHTVVDLVHIVGLVLIHLALDHVLHLQDVTGMVDEEVQDHGFQCETCLALLHENKLPRLPLPRLHQDPLCEMLHDNLSVKQHHQPNKPHRLQSQYML